jgi:hypothetical protein
VRPGDEAFTPQTVPAHFPAPIGLAYQRFLGQRPDRPRERFERLFKALQATLRYLSFLGLADLFRHLARTYAPLPEHRAFDCLREPCKLSLGHWAAILGETCRHLLAVPDPFVRELPDVGQPGGRLDTVLVRWLINQRNLAEHTEGDLPLSDTRCGNLVREARPRLEEAFQVVSFVRRYPLGFLSQAGDPRGGRHRYRLHSCMGARIADSDQAVFVSLATPLLTETPFVVSPDGRSLLYLWPLLRQRTSEQSQRPALYVFERLAEHARFLDRMDSAAIDHADEWEDPAPVPPVAPATGIDWLWGKLRAEYSPPALPAELDLPGKLAGNPQGQLVGQNLGGFVLERVIGSGGFGTIYYARGPDGQPAAVKVLESREAQRHLPRFEREFERLHQAGQHPGVVRCLAGGDAEEVAGRLYPWYAMEYAAGGDLAGRIEERRQRAAGRYPWFIPELRAEVVREFQAIMAAVTCLHEQERLVHRDLKPSNVLIGEGGELLLSDFGLVKDVSPGAVAHTSAGAVMGTPLYMAPEQRRGSATFASDVYALGILLAELAVGERPVSDPDLPRGSALMTWHPLRKLPLPLHDLVLACTSTQPPGRPPDGRALGERFGKVLRELGEPG